MGLVDNSVYADDEEEGRRGASVAGGDVGDIRGAVECGPDADGEGE